MNKEIWRDIPWFKGVYQGSNRGRIRTVSRWVDKNGIKVFVVGSVVKPEKDKKGDYYIVHYVGCRPYYKLVHRLIAEAFILNPDKYPVMHFPTDSFWKEFGKKE